MKLKLANIVAGWLTGESTVKIRNFWASVQILPYVPDCFLWSPRTYDRAPSSTTILKHSKSLNHTEILYSSPTDDV